MTRKRDSPRRGFAMIGATIKVGQRPVNFAVSWHAMKMHAPRRVADLVASALPQLSDRLVEIRIRAHWGALVGPDMARRTQPGRLEHGCLTVTVDNSPWLQELTLRQAELTSRLADQVPEVQRLRLVLGTLT